MYTLQQFAHATSRRRASLFEGVRAVVSVTGPSARHIINVNICVMSLAGFFVAVWLAFFGLTFVLAISLSLLTPRLMTAGALAGLTVLPLSGLIAVGNYYGLVTKSFATAKKWID